jgi:ABC-2 type transport system permease protein
MTRLLRVELTRLRWRRAVLLLLALAVVIPTVVFGAIVWNTRPVSAAELERVEQQVREEAESPQMQRDLERCVAKPRQYGAGRSPDVRATCEDMMLPRVEWYTERPALDLGSQRRESGLAVVVVLTMLLVLVGTTFVGHDWNSGSMSNQLLFEPRRARVWAAKGAVVLLIGLVVAGLVLGAYWTGLWWVAEHRGIEIADGTMREAYQQALRGALLAGFAGLGGYALTMLFRSTVATLGVLFGVAIAGPLLITMLGFPGHQRFMPQNNVAAVLFERVRIVDYNQSDCFIDGRRPADHCVTKISTAGGSGYFGGLLLLAGVPSLLAFRRRDIP